MTAAEEAARLGAAYRAVKNVARDVGIIDGDSAKDNAIPSELKAAMMAWATSINIELNRRGTVGAANAAFGHSPNADSSPATKTNADSSPATKTPAVTERPQQSPEGEWYFSCAKCGQRVKWSPRGAAAGLPPPAGARCWPCWKGDNPR